MAVERFEYDVAGNLTACQNEAIRIERKYDREGRLVEEAQGDWAVIRYDYDLLGKLTSRTTKVTKGEAVQTQTVKYAYDVLGGSMPLSCLDMSPSSLCGMPPGGLRKRF